MRIFGLGVGVALLLLGTIFVLNYYEYRTVAFFAPKYEGVRRDVMIESRAYGEGQTREMYRLKLQYQQAGSDDEAPRSARWRCTKRPRLIVRACRSIFNRSSLKSEADSMKRLVIFLAPLLLAACKDDSGAARESRQTVINQNQASTVVGMPGIVNFTEKRMLKMIYELRDNPKLVTYSYYLDLGGKRHRVCPTTSLGYGFPYATQYTAPKAPRITAPTYPDGTQGPWHTYEADQPEPNGLYMPSSADGTWVLCLSPDGKDVKPVYVEPRIVVYPFEMQAID